MVYGVTKAMHLALLRSYSALLDSEAEGMHLLVYVAAVDNVDTSTDAGTEHTIAA